MLKVLGWIVVIVVALAAGAYVAFQVSPWPSALIVRGFGGRRGFD